MKVGVLVGACMMRCIVRLVALIAVSTGAVSVAAVPQTWAAGCTDLYETQAESLTLPGANVAVPVQINRSLCGLYDGDYVAFTGALRTTHHIEILNFESPKDLQLTVYADDGTGNYRLVNSVSGMSGLDLPSNISGRYIVNIGSGRSRLGLYGGGDYVFKLSAAGS